ncbi:hypothetical protein NKH77_38550 [Streptomyces sp. M19]
MSTTTPYVLPNRTSGHRRGQAVAGSPAACSTPPNCSRRCRRPSANSTRG